ncbi:hypothetical protein HC928_15005 [bacterium]|nr:hypothetical protein [bacterium]
MKDWYLKLTISLILVLAVLFRVVNLGDKPYWNMDEAYTLLRASGYTAEEADQGFLQGDVVALSDFQKYLEPSQKEGARGTIAGLAKEEPQHPPFYYLLTRFWQQGLGTSKVAQRSLPVLFSLLAFPAIYWLCRELFDRPLVAWLTMILYGVSPVMLEFATFIRPYSLFLLETVVASSILLRSLRQETKLGWILYATTMAIAFYTHLLAGLVAIAHGIYVLISERFRFGTVVRRFLLSGMAVAVIALPWFYVVWQNLQTAQRTTDWTKNASPFFDLVQLWLKYLNRGFLAWHFQYESIFAWTIIPLLVLIVWSFIFFCRNASFKTRTFILSLLGISFLPFLLTDLILGGVRSTAYRFFLICYVGMDVFIAYLLASKLSLEIKVLRKLDFGVW